jgi:membrane-associated protein
VDPFFTTSLLTVASPYAATAVFLVLLVESALPVGFVLPGDTLLLTSGLACATGHLSLPWMLSAAVGGAVLGAQAGYLLGRLGARVLLPGPRTHHVQRAMARFEQLSERRGYGPALIAARFIPVARSVAGPFSGLLRIPVGRFTAWQVAGGITWPLGVTLTGYGVGWLAPGLERYLPLFLLLTALSFPITAGLGYLLLRVRTRGPLVRSPAITTRQSDEETAHL